MNSQVIYNQVKIRSAPFWPTRWSCPLVIGLLTVRNVGGESERRAFAVSVYSLPRMNEHGMPSHFSGAQSLA